MKGTTFALITLESNPEQWNIRTILIEGTKPVVPLCDDDKGCIFKCMVSWLFSRIFPPLTTK